MTVSERIFDLLRKQGKKQGNLARALNVRPTTVSEWKTGKREPSAVFLCKNRRIFRRIARLSYYGATTTRRTRTTNYRQQ